MFPLYKDNYLHQKHIESHSYQMLKRLPLTTVIGIANNVCFLNAQLKDTHCRKLWYNKKMSGGEIKGKKNTSRLKKLQKSLIQRLFCMLC